MSDEIHASQRTPDSTDGTPAASAPSQKDGDSWSSTLRYGAEADFALADPHSTYGCILDLAGSPKVVLDVGCNTGYLGQAFLSRGSKVYGVDVDASAVEQATSTGLRARQADLDLVALDSLFTPTKFDVIIFADVLEHLKRPDTVLEAATKMLADGGKIIVSIPNVAHANVRLRLLLGDFHYEEVGLLDWTHIRFFTAETADELLSDAGFAVEDSRVVKSPLDTGLLQRVIDRLNLGTEGEAGLLALLGDANAEAFQYVLSAKPNEDSEGRAHSFWIAAPRPADDAHARYVCVDRVEERDAEIQRLQANVTEMETWGLNSARAVLERDELIRDLQERLQRSAELSEDLQKRLQQSAELSEELQTLRGSTGWAIVLFARRMYRLAMPRGSLQCRFFWFVVRCIQLWRTEGTRGLARAILVRPFERWFGKHRDARHAALIDGPLVESSGRPRASFPRTHAQPGHYDLIILPIIDWAFRFQRPQQLALRLAKAGHRVFYVRTTFCAGSEAVLASIVDNVMDVQLPGPPKLSIYADAPSSELVDKAINSLIALRQEWQINDAVCVVQLPFWTQIGIRLRKALGWKLVYDCMDDYEAFSNTERGMLAEAEELSSASDMVLASSQSLLEKQQTKNLNSILVRNAGEFEHFLFPPPVIPAEVEDLPQPIIGYYGAISDWFDSALVGEIARAKPSWNFVLIGSTALADLAPLKGVRNVHLLGELPYEVLPAYLHRFNVCFIPFKRTPLTEATNPVKLFEFLSAGKPIVATELGELRHYADYIRLVSKREGWVPALEQALEDSAQEVIRKRVDFARLNTWDQRALQVQEQFSNLFTRVSVIIVTYNNLDYTRLCLESLYGKTSYPNYEVIIVDNGSQDGTPAFLQEFAANHAHCRIVLNESNEGFARANNHGLALAQGEVIVFLNNDTILTRGWLSTLVRHLHDERIGLIGPVTNWSGNESRINVSYRSIAEMDSFAESYVDAHLNELFDIRVLALFCAAGRRSVLEQVGPLDERFGIGMFEDDDYAHRVRELGYRVVCAEDAYVHHWGRASFSKMEEERYQELFAENLSKFEEKWATKWQPHQYRRELMPA